MTSNNTLMNLHAALEPVGRRLPPTPTTVDGRASTPRVSGCVKRPPPHGEGTLNEGMV
jgi:hypothetical protein